MITLVQTEEGEHRPVCRDCHGVGGQTHNRVSIVPTLAGRWAYDTVTCRRCSAQGFYNFR